MNRKTWILISTALAAIVLTLILSRSESMLNAWSVEDEPMEYLSSLLWLAGAILCFVCFGRVSGSLKWLFLFLGLFYFFFFGEEISWGPRLFNCSFKTIESRSNQEEFNLHNLDIFSKKSFYDNARGGRINPLLLFNTQNLFRLGCLIGCGAFPLLLWMDRPRGWRTSLSSNPPFLTFLICTWTVHLFVWTIRFMINSQARESMNEVGELWSALFIWLIMKPHPQSSPSETVKGS
jgi:hypothetical protein